MDTSLSFLGGGLFSWPTILLQIVIVVFSLCVWSRYFSPLADIPGPFAASFTRLWHLRRIWIGDQNLQVVSLHEKHGRPTST